MQKGRFLGLRTLSYFQLGSWGSSPASPKMVVVGSYWPRFSRQEGNNLFQS